jgi:glutamate racemase
MIGFYDSGIGGLNILTQVKKRLPFLDTFYMADDLHCPLGEKDEKQIQEIVTNGVKYLMENDCKLVILACNTATAITIKYLQNTWLPKNYPTNKVLGIIRPVSEELRVLNIATEQKIAILGTPATINSQFYFNELRDFGYNNILNLSAAGLALAIENDNKESIDTILNDLFLRYQNEINSTDVLVLACTHYPYALESICNIWLKQGGNKNIQIINQDYLVATRLEGYLNRHPQFTSFNNLSKSYSSKTKSPLNI